MQRWPFPKATKKLRDRVRELTDTRQSGKDVTQIIAKLTPVIRGWGNYFRTGNLDRLFNEMDSFVYHSIRRWQPRRVANSQPGPRHSPVICFTRWVCIACVAPCDTRRKPHHERSSVSRVPENGTHGLKGERRNGWHNGSTAL
jgi:hypothetical protein